MFTGGVWYWLLVIFLFFFQSLQSNFYTTLFIPKESTEALLTWRNTVGLLVLLIILGTGTETDEAEFAHRVDCLRQFFGPLDISKL